MTWKTQHGKYGKESDMYKPVSAGVSLAEREKEVEKFWRENDIFRRSMENRKEGPVYTFYDGPPTANEIGRAHV